MDSQALPIRIILGGQTGADQGGLLAARELGILAGGTAPQSWLTETGPNEQLLRSFGLTESAVPGYDSRTRANVLDSDGTLIFGSYAAGGSALTMKIARNANKPVFHVPFPSPKTIDVTDKILEFRQWLQRYQVRTLNVAGNRESQNPGLQEFVKYFLLEALRPR